MHEKLKAISLRLKPEIMDRIDMLAVPMRMPRTSWVYQAIMDKLKKDEKKLD